MNSKQVVVTRAAHQAAELASLLEASGVVALLYPSIALLPAENTALLDAGIQQAARGEFDWIVLTSANTVLALSGRLDALGLPREAVGRAKIAAVGPATANAVRSSLHATVAGVPRTYDARHLAQSLGPLRGRRVFLPQSDSARPSLADALTAAGAEILAATAYRETVGSGGVDLPRLLDRNRIDAITFTSSATVENFMKRFSAEGGDAGQLHGVGAICLGLGATRTVEKLGFGRALTARENTLHSLVEAVRDFLSA
jgi:uroporphyrinogen III methyltransferase/synthase